MTRMYGISQLEACRENAEGSRVSLAGFIEGRWSHTIEEALKSEVDEDFMFWDLDSIGIISPLGPPLAAPKIAPTSKPKALQESDFPTLQDVQNGEDTI